MTNWKGLPMAIDNHQIANKPTGLSRADNPAIAAEPPASSDIPLRGQLETNQDDRRADEGDGATPVTSAAKEQPYQLAFDFGRRTALQYGRDRSTPLEFDAHEPQLAQEWSKQRDPGVAELPWQQARAAAREAWNQVQDAIVGDKQAK